MEEGTRLGQQQILSAVTGHLEMTSSPLAGWKAQQTFLDTKGEPICLPSVGSALGSSPAIACS